MSPKEITKVDITEEIFKEPIEVIKKLSANVEELKYTKVIQTYVMENRKLSLSLEKEGSSYLKGKIVWIGNKKDDTEGVIFCIDTRNELKQVNPTPENTSSAILDLKRESIRLETTSKSRCSVCGKNIEIFDETAGCPLCESKAHRDHLIDWIRMKHSCPICKKSLNVTSTGTIYID
ncbi:MAG: hypothetical protein ACTSQJ_15895 [Promethearchaeota archaeon]